MSEAALRPGDKLIGAAAPPSAAAPPAYGPGSMTPRRADGSVNWTMLIVGFGAMMTGQFMAILDIQIVAASLPQIQAGIGASLDEISWIQTSYLIAEVVMIPLSGFLSRLWGTRAVFMWSCAGFIVMSVATGFATSIEQMILFRSLQGFVGGAMIPTAFAVAFGAFPPNKRMLSSLIASMIVSLAPTFGPTLGGYLTDALSWRWLFFINVPPGLLVLVLVWKYGNFDQGDPRLAKGFDWAGLVLMAVFLMGTQYVLEEGAGENWFEDDIVLWLTVIVAISGGAFIWRQIDHPNPIVQVRAFADWNFTVGIVMTFVSGVALFGGTFLIPQYLAEIRGYSATQIGTTMMVSGIGMLLTGPIAGRLAQTLDARIQMLIGFGIAGAGFWLGTFITPDWGYWEFALLQALRSFGLMMAMLSTQNVTMASLPPELLKSASGLVSLSRNVGGAFGLAILATTLTQGSAAHMHELAARMSISSERAQGLLAGMTERMTAMGVADPEGAARKAVWSMLQREAMTLTFADAFALVAISCFAAAVLAQFGHPKKPSELGMGAGPRPGPAREPAH